MTSDEQLPTECFVRCRLIESEGVEVQSTEVIGSEVTLIARLMQLVERRGTSSDEIRVRRLATQSEIAVITAFQPRIEEHERSVEGQKSFETFFDVSVAFELASIEDMRPVVDR